LLQVFAEERLMKKGAEKRTAGQIKTNNPMNTSEGRENKQKKPEEKEKKKKEGPTKEENGDICAN